VTRPPRVNPGARIFGRMATGFTIRRQAAGAARLGERDLRIALGAARFADGTLGLLIVSIVVALVALPEQSRTWLRPFFAADVLVALLIARTLGKNIYTVGRYRRERA
jgi:hypothetical protein